MKEAYLYIVEKSVAWEFDSPEYGRLARKVVELLYDRKEDLTDDRVAILLNISTAETRRILQYLMKLGLVGVKKRTTEDYRIEYTWYVDDDVIRQAIKNRAKVAKEKISSLIKSLTEGAYYVCPTCHMRYTLDQAVNYGGVCPVCGTQLEYVENVEEIDKLTKAYESIDKI
ncbi:transcription factor [Pyrobaculum neutrophilum]|uniref:Transcription factor E n=1 Tax=Pyrobaculum neutrophilum (strain DSM 2338 / JCM 9278 / NBRC 100436 / V24Sta) TaxID=444157 RepID=TFE_PYRNV|nr:transcription factor [Pyrobaculum neutrophilum]B1YA16.1 RecName: Full=Transcription factor E; Short=TFE; AltName: Full=TFIIE subunit alpha homolog; AltName: Full=Transcription initiation factor TFIIE [Pyrobaculum neutrophilum V24Sta]ACB38990.1 Transcription factor TFIIE, alpha subunit [Pyrobaculum neutrophilum V24Sta]